MRPRSAWPTDLRRASMARKKARRPYRSKFEERLGAQLDAAGVEFGYETETFKITLAVPGNVCGTCGSKDISRVVRYTPDFFLPHVIVEAKGRFTGRDRKKALAFIAQYPERNYGLLFMRNNTLSKSSKTRYSDWCNDNCVPFTIGTFPKEWLK